MLGIISGRGLIASERWFAMRTIEFSSLVRTDLTTGEVATLIVYAILMVGVMLACAVPTMRALRAQPTEARRAE